MAKVSKGERDSVSRADTKMIRRERTYTEKMTNIMRAWKKGQNPWLTIANSDPLKTNQKFVKVQSNDIWGNPKYKNKTIQDSSF